MEAITITLNGREVSAPPGSTILELARQVGVEIPTLCHHPLLKSAGACRVCLVEEAKSGRVVASCVTPIAQGMEIRTDSAAAFQSRRGVLELILSDHPSACVICSKGNQCILRTLAKDHGICDPDLEPIRHWRPLEAANPFIVRDLTKCVMCGRCIRMCKDFEAVGAIDYMERGYAGHPGTSNRSSLELSECNFCGSCVAACPTDALAERDRVCHSSGKEHAPAVCFYCGTGCHLHYELVGGAVVGARGVLGTPVNSHSLCVRGHYGQDALSSPMRLTEPLVRRDEGKYEGISWSDALDHIAARLKNIVGEHGPSSVGVIVGTQCSNEDLYLAARLARSALKTPNLDSTARFSSATVVEGLEASLGSFRTGGSLDKILNAQTIVLIGARPDYTHPVVARNVRQAVRNKGAALVQIDPLTTSLSPFAAVQLSDGVDEPPYVLYQLMRAIVAEKLHDEAFLLANAVNAPDFIANLETAEHDFGPEVRRAAQLMGKGRKSVFILGPQLARSSQGYMLTRLAVNLALLSGEPGNILFLFQGCNELGTWELGCAPDRFPGGSHVLDSHALETIEKIWKTEICPQPGLRAMEMLHNAEKGNLRALLLLGVDPLAAFPNPERTRRTLSGIDLVVRTGLFPATQEELAHFVIPAASIAEMDGTYTSAEARVQRVSTVYAAPGNSQSCSRFLLDLVAKLGSPVELSAAEDVFRELRSICSGWSKLNWADLGMPGGVVLPYPRDGVSTPRSRRKPRMVPYTLPEPLLRLRPAHPTPEDTDRWWKVYPEEQPVYPGDSVMSRRSRRLSRYMRTEWVRINPQDAERIGVEDGAMVLIGSDVGEVKARVALDPEVPLSGAIIPLGGPDLMLQRLVDWPEEGSAPGWDTLFVSIKPLE